MRICARPCAIPSTSIGDTFNTSSRCERHRRRKTRIFCPFAAEVVVVNIFDNLAGIENGLMIGAAKGRREYGGRE